MAGICIPPPPRPPCHRPQPATLSTQDYRRLARVSDVNRVKIVQKFLAVVFYLLPLHFGGEELLLQLQHLLLQRRVLTTHNRATISQHPPSQSHG